MLLTNGRSGWRYHFGNGTGLCGIPMQPDRRSAAVFANKAYYAAMKSVGKWLASA
jgi:hypothetical protein